MGHHLHQKIMIILTIMIIPMIVDLHNKKIIMIMTIHSIMIIHMTMGHHHRHHQLMQLNTITIITTIIIQIILTLIHTIIPIIIRMITRMIIPHHNYHQHHKTVVHLLLLMDHLILHQSQIQ